MRPPSLYHSLQYMRGVAALLVVFFHAVVAFYLAVGPAGTWLAWVGSSGVDIFFVLSGFVIWTSTAQHETSPLAFYRRRLARVVPLYWLSTLLLIGLALALPGGFRTTVLTAPHVLASFAFVPWPNPGLLSSPFMARMVPVLVPGWSLNFELYFYLLFGIALLAPRRLRLLAALAAILLATAACWMQRAQSPIFTFYASPMIAEFVAGMLIGAWAGSAQSPRRPAAALILAIAGAAALLPLEWGARPFVGIAAVAIVLGLVWYERSARVPRWRALELIGDASYSLYLSHIFVIGALRPVVVLAARLLPIDHGWLEIVYVALCCIAAVILGVAVHRTVERPLLRLLRGRRPVAMSQLKESLHAPG